MAIDQNFGFPSPYFPDLEKGYEPDFPYLGKPKVQLFEK